MADLFICRATFTTAKGETGKFGKSSAMYAFQTNGFAQAESLAYAKVRKEATYHSNAKVTSIKRKNLSELDTVATKEGMYLYRASVRKIKKISNDKYYNLSFVFLSAANPAENPQQQLLEEIKPYIAEKGYTFEEGVSSATFSYELSKTRLGAIVKDVLDETGTDETNVGEAMTETTDTGNE